VDGLNSNLNLNEGLVPRLMPRIGDWGPDNVQPTRKKKRMRWFAVGGFILVAALVVGYGYWMYTLFIG
jgi:nitrate reductase NapE component